MNYTLPEFYCPYSDECYQCCLETEMTLSEEDITRIENRGYEIEEFLEESDGFMVLQNVNKHCVFLKENKCSIYEFRPQGCRFYPLIYDFEIEDIRIDNLCDHHEDFDVEIYRPLFDAVQAFVYTLISERETRVKRTYEEEIKEEVKETQENLGDSLTKERQRIESDKEKIERLIEQSLIKTNDKEITSLEDELISEISEIEDELSELEKDIKADIDSADEYIRITEESIKRDLENLEKKRREQRENK